jgi:imidazolonepropionase-like amidohydrolase/ketosteroid isomerase-like protein
MFLKTLFFFLFLFQFNLIFSQTYITDVTIADVENQKLIPHQTVIITGDKISKIQAADKVSIPANAIVVAGEGKFLFPGLIDAHVHFSQTGGLYTRPDAIDLREFKPYQEEIDWSHDHMEEVLRRYLQAGITTVIDVGTTVNFLKQRELFKNATYSPTIYMAGPLLTTYEPEVFRGLNHDSPFNLFTSVEDAKKQIEQQLIYHPDLLKIWYIVGQDTSDIETSARNYLPIVKAIIDEVHRNHLKIAIHATERITAQLSVENGCDYLVHSVDDEILSDDFVKLLKKKKTILCPTLVVHDGYVNTFGQNLSMTAHDLKTGDPYQLGSLLDLKHIADTNMVRNYKSYSNTHETQARSKKVNDIMRINLKKLSDGGVTIATGTDAGNIGTLHAASYIAELKAMQESGMTNWQILQASTVNGAKVLDKEKEFGTITEGKSANLILLDASPVENLDHLAQIHRVINKGKVIDPNTLVRETPEALVQRQLNAYNFRNIEAFLETYADDVEVYKEKDQLLYKGKEEMRKFYTKRFENSPGLHCEILNRIVQGNVVIDKEHVQIAGDRFIDGVVMYQVEEGRIKRVYFVQ